MFSLPALLASPHPHPPGAPLGGVDPRSLAKKEYKFAAVAVPALRLPAGADAITDLLTSLSTGDDVLDGAVLATLRQPATGIPLTDDEEGSRRLALLAAVEVPAGIALVEIRLDVERPAGKFAPVTWARGTVAVHLNRDSMLDALIVLYADAAPEARAKHATSVSIWIGANGTELDKFGDWRTDLKAILAAHGYAAEINEQASRYKREIRSRLGSHPTPALVVMWNPHAYGAQDVLDAVQDDADVVTLDETDYHDMLVELRMFLGELTSPADLQGMHEVATAGETRYYIKHYGSAAGDVMIVVTDCEHGQWGSDNKRKAPRALKGIGNLEQRVPKDLHKCKLCSKNRWRARF